MALPPKGDPRRDLALAIRTGWVLSVLMIVLFLLVTMVFGLISATSRGLRTYVAALAIGIFAAEMLCLLIPTIFLTQRKKWAAIVLIVVASIGALGGLINLIGGLVKGQIPTAIIGGIIVLALVQFIVYLAKAPKGIDYELMMKNNWTGGFEPIMKPGAVPPPPPQPPPYPTSPQIPSQNTQNPY